MTMDNRTLEALNGAIEKWERIARGVGEDRSTENCPLCNLFYQDGCRAGPVYESNPSFYKCRGTPYRDWANHMQSLSQSSKRHWPWLATNDVEKRMAQDEVDFLKSLLPKLK